MSGASPEFRFEKPWWGSSEQKALDALTTASEGLAHAADHVEAGDVADDDLEEFADFVMDLAAGAINAVCDWRDAVASEEA